MVHINYAHLVKHTYLLFFFKPASIIILLLIIIIIKADTYILLNQLVIRVLKMIVAI